MSKPIGKNSSDQKKTPEQELKMIVKKPIDPDAAELLNDIPGKTKFEKFNMLRGIGYDEEQIRKYLNISKNAFRLMELRANENVSNYMRYQAKTGHMVNLKQALLIEWRNVLKLQKRADIASKNCDKYPEDRKLIYTESHVRQTLSHAIEQVYQLQIKTPLAAAFDAFVKENIVEGSQKKVKKGLPLLPEELTN